jgi:hypothetical protein
MREHTKDLRELYLDVTDEATTVTEHQREEPSREPMEEDEEALLSAVAGAANEHGLDDAVEGADVSEVDDGSI